MTEETLKLPIFHLHSRNRDFSPYRNTREPQDSNDTDVLPYTHVRAPKGADPVRVEVAEEVADSDTWARHRLPPQNIQN